MPVVTITGTMTFPFGILSAPVTYPAPTRSELASAIARDLRDPDNTTFSTETLDDFIRMAFVEVSSFYPKEATELVQLVADIYQYGLELQDVWRVEVYSADGNLRTLGPTNGETVADGWEFFAGTLHLIDGTSFDADTDPDVGDFLRVWGYMDRNPPVSDDDICDLDGPAERAVREYCRMQAFEALVGDRSLFGQWASLPGNTDVSLTQVLQMVDIFHRQWEQRRRQMKLLRRVS